MQEAERRSCRGKLGVCKVGRGDSKARRSARRRGAATGQIADERSGDARRWAEITRVVAGLSPQRMAQVNERSATESAGW
jgi:hypothetical protein